ncbi:Protein NRT1/ PTR FAMILY 2.3 [Dichanthelium oligosanthes]|uniref:Protein NRT1/ PTR FAMILY 2.3 n=1 Tax=Dichanthelium oligosanthes TaxID=888268 RepID=A0A1E5VK42_9POAL|nr:Protein NRT1/ PTR FAMILY 2.3 [Dichanthelium oligosanthes]
MEMESSPGSQLKPVHQEAQERPGRNRGGWITLPFIAGSMLGLGLAINGTTSNLLVYLLKEYNVESIDAAQIANIIRGSLNLVPVAGAVVSDSYFGCFPVILAGTVINILAFVLFTLTAALPSLRPPHCAPPSAVCPHGTPGQLTVLYAAVCLLAIGTGGTRFNVATLGADQFGSAHEQDTFFNWYFVFLYASFIVGDTAIVYLQDGVSWALGFSVCLGTTVASLVMLLLGARYYRMPVPKGSPYTELARVVVAAVRKARVDVAGRRLQYYVGDGTVADSGSDGAPSKRLGFLNRAAVITASDGTAETTGGGHRSSGWRLCTVQQVEDLKSLLGVLPLWSSGILVSVSIGVMIGMVILQGLAMDRSLGPTFKIPAGSITVCSLAAFIAATPVLERAVFPLWCRVTGVLPTPLQRVGLGHVVNVAGMVAAALVERRRLSVMRAHHGADEALGWVTPMSVLWLLIPLAIVGVGEALHFPGNMAFYYQEFPKTLRSTATAMAPLLIAMGFYLSTVFVDVVRRVTAWLPGNINQGRLDNVYWTVAVTATVNFGYFLVCVCLYKSRK